MLSKLSRNLCPTEWLDSFGIAGVVYRQNDFAVHSAVREQAHLIYMCLRRRVERTRRFARIVWLFAVKLSTSSQSEHDLIASGTADLRKRGFSLYGHRNLQI